MKVCLKRVGRNEFEVEVTRDDGKTISENAYLLNLWLELFSHQNTGIWNSL